MMAQMALAGECFQLVTANDGVEALDQARRHHPDLILLDIIMPRMDGFEVCQRLRAEAETRETPILMITTRGEETNVERGYEVGCTDYICKPFIPAELLEKIRFFLPRG